MCLNYVTGTIKKVINESLSKDKVFYLIEEAILSNLVVFFIFAIGLENPIIGLVDYLYFLPLTFLLLISIHYFWFFFARAKDLDVSLTVGKIKMKFMELDEKLLIRKVVKMEKDYFKISLILATLTFGLLHIPVIGYNLGKANDSIKKCPLVELFAKIVDLWDFSPVQYFYIFLVFSLLVNLTIFSLINRLFVVILAIITLNSFFPWTYLINTYFITRPPGGKKALIDPVGFSLVISGLVDRLLLPATVILVISFVLAFFAPFVPVLFIPIITFGYLIYSLAKGKEEI